MDEWHRQFAEDELRRENRELRKMLAFAYSPHLYTDDGEFSCGADTPSIDFKRMSVDEIKQCMRIRTQRAIERLSPDDIAKLLNRT